MYYPNAASAAPIRICKISTICARANTIIRTNPIVWTRSAIPGISKTSLTLVKAILTQSCGIIIKFPRRTSTNLRVYTIPSASYTLRVIRNAGYALP